MRAYKKETSFACNVKVNKHPYLALLPTSETGMMHTINKELLVMFTQCIWVRDYSLPYHITNNDTAMYDVIKIDESIQGSSFNMKAAQKGKLHVKVRQVDGSEILHTLCPVKYCKQAGTNLSCLICELVQGSKLYRDENNNIILDTVNGKIVLDCKIKTIDGWIARSKSSMRGQAKGQLHKANKLVN